MKKVSLITLITLFGATSLVPMNVFSQEISETEMPLGLGQVSIESVHQLEWEAHKEAQSSDLVAPKLSSKTNAPEVEPIDLIPKQTAPDKTIFGYLPYWGYKYYPELNYDLLTTIAYFGLDINGSGEITNAHNWPATELINHAHRRGVRVVPAVVLFNAKEITKLLSSEENRSRLIGNLLSAVQSAHADGVSIDFEGVPNSDNEKADLVTFMTELADRFHTEIPGSEVTMFTPAVDWRKVFDYSALAQVTDGLIMQGYDFHWSTSPTAGPGAPLTGTRWGNHNVTRTVDDYVSKTAGNVDKLILSVPYYGLEWKTQDDQLESPTAGRATSIFYHDAYINGVYHGRLWDTESQTPWYKWVNSKDGQWHQGWYNDAESLETKLDLVRDKNLQGVAIWALTYDGDRRELKETFKDRFGSAVPPVMPEALRVHDTVDGIEVSIDSSEDAIKYKYYLSLDGQTFYLVHISSSASFLFPLIFPLEQPFYFKVSAVNEYGESKTTKPLSATHSLLQQAPVLIVDGATQQEDKPTAVIHLTEALLNYGVAFESVDQKAIEWQRIDLRDYAAVIWLAGRENNQFDSFNLLEQAQISDFLEQGGKLFVSGSEIGFDLSAKGNEIDNAFYADYLKTIYIQDRVDGNILNGSTGSLFESIEKVSFDDGSHGSYNVASPDGIQPVNGAEYCMTFEGYDAAETGGACVQYQGFFGDGNIPGQLVYMSVPFETLYPVKNRHQVMENVLTYFEIEKQTACAFLDFTCLFQRWLSHN